MFLGLHDSSNRQPLCGTLSEQSAPRQGLMARSLGIFRGVDASSSILALRACSVKVSLVRHGIGLRY